MEPSIKGSLLAVGLAQLFQLVERGKIDVREVEATLGREWFEAARGGRIAPSAWYPVDFYDRVLVLMMNRAGDGRSEYLVELGRQGAVALASQGIYKQLGRKAGDEVDERFVRQLLTLAKALYSFTVWDLEALDADAGWFVIRINEAARYPDSLRWRNCGFLETMTSEAVGRPCTLVSERPSPDLIRFRIQWRTQE
ncbi:MAG TPA: hypothetical protein VMR31_00025 [Myxococcota bacterium]|nr:hypothetical protein [Myxococcota bacterium]